MDTRRIHLLTSLLWSLTRSLVSDLYLSGCIGYIVHLLGNLSRAQDQQFLDHYSLRYMYYKYSQDFRTYNHHPHKRRYFLQLINLNRSMPPLGSSLVGTSLEVERRENCDDEREFSMGQCQITKKKKT